ncbi:MAG: cell surface protein [Phycisphaeraceae bacterium]|nr:cell surface protein [Phycisphaeraceae bacterium]
MIHFLSHFKSHRPRPTSGSNPFFFLALCSFLWLSGVVAPTYAKENTQPPAPAPVAIDVYPADVNLETKDDHQSLVVVATWADGTTRDVTADCAIAPADADLVSIEGPIVRPAADGQTELRIAFGDQHRAIPVAVRDAAVKRPISFRLDVMPVFMSAGCNSGSCHGSARGQDGFRLSLFGFDPGGDYHRITRELSSRRLNLALVDESMVIDKSLGRVPHSGGKRFEEGSRYHRTLLDWLEAGVPDDPPDVARPVSIEIMPRQVVMEGPGATQQMTVRARYSDGTDRDVTDLTVFLSSNDTSAKVSPRGLVTVAERGEAFVMARFATFTEGSQVIVIPRDLDYERPELAETNYVDRLVHEKLHKLRMLPSPTCSDQAFLRRASLDITGALPTAEEFRRFMEDEAPDKREKLVDQLLSRKAFSEMWVMKWAELLQIRTNNSNQMSYKATLSYFNWLAERMAGNVPFNEVARDLLSGTGGTFTNAATNYYQIERDALKTAENVAQVFMGMRIQCAQCHNHPFDRWTMDDYYGFAAFFSQIGRKGAEDPREVIVYNKGSGEIKHPLGGRTMPPKYLGGATPELAGRDRRRVMADWIASKDNPFFARNLANMVWAHFFGVGIIEPVDDVRISNPPSNPELLDELARRFTEYDYDFKRLVRDICVSRTYQRATATNDTNRLDTRNFAHALIRRVRAEVLLDAISAVTETKNKFPGLPLGARAVQIADGNVSNYFLTTFGRAKRTSVCSCEVLMEPNLSQALHLLNGETTQKRIADGKVVPRMIESGATPDQVVESLYVRCLSRRPTDQEKQKLSTALASAKDSNQELADVFWALLNSKEFIFNH